MNLNRVTLLTLLTGCILILVGCSGKVTTVKKDEATTDQGSPTTSATAPVTDHSTTPAPNAAPEELFSHAIKLLTTGNDKGAEALLLALSKSHPELPGSFTNLGIIYYQRHLFDKAQESFEQALKLKPANAYAHLYLGLIQRQAGHFATAQAAYLKALEINPNYANAHLNLAILFDLYLGQLDKALPHYQKYQELVEPKEKQVDVWIRDLQKRLSGSVSTAVKDSP